MHNFYLSFSVVFPIICLLSLGYALTLLKVFDDTFLKKLNIVNFEVFMPILLFTSIYRASFSLTTTVPLILFAVSSVFIIFLVLLFLIPRIVSTKADFSVVIQGIYRSNFVLFGLPITASIYGNDNLTMTSILIAFIIPMYNVFAVIVLPSKNGDKTSIWNVIKELRKNPLIISSLLAIVFLKLEIDLPILLQETMLDVAAIATPLALIALGASFKMTGLKKYKKSLTIGVLGKLIFLPLIFIPLSVFLGFRNMELTALMAMFSTPTAITSYTMAQVMGANDELAGQIVVVTSIASVVTIFICVSILQYYQLI